MRNPSAVLNLDNIRELIKQIPKSTFNDVGIDLVYIGGSVASGAVHTESDLDLFLSLPRYTNLSAKDKYEVLQDIFDVFGCLNIDNIDFSILEETRPDIRLKVLQDDICVYKANDTVKAVFIEDTMKIAYDYKIWLNKYYNWALEEKV